MKKEQVNFYIILIILGAAFLFFIFQNNLISLANEPFGFDELLKIENEKCQNSTSGFRSYTEGCTRPTLVENEGNKEIIEIDGNCYMDGRAKMNARCDKKVDEYFKLIEKMTDDL